MSWWKVLDSVTDVYLGSLLNVEVTGDKLKVTAILPTINACLASNCLALV